MERLEEQVQIVSNQQQIFQKKQAALAELNRKKREMLLGLTNELLPTSGFLDTEPEDQPNKKAAKRNNNRDHLTVQPWGFNSETNVTQQSTQALKAKDSALSTGVGPKKKKSKLSVLGISNQSLKLTPRQEKQGGCKTKIKVLQVSSLHSVVTLFL